MSERQNIDPESPPGGRVETTGSGEVKSFGFFLVPRFAMLAFTSAVEPLRAANLLSGKQLYRWKVLTVDGEPVAASNGTRLIADAKVEDGGDFDNVVVCSGLDAHLFQDKSVFAWLRRSAREGARIGALSDGSYILARAGLLDGYRCTIHWNCLDGFQETFPDIDVRYELYEIDRHRFTSSGGTASLDLMLHMIEEDHGRALAVRVAEQFMHDRIRTQDDDQRMSLRLRVGVGHPKLLAAIKLMEDNLEQPLSSQELAEQTGISSRQLERLFQKYLGCPPRAYYLELRLRRAHMLLTHSSLSVMEIGLACGFVSASHFAKRYREMFSQAPQKTRLGQPPTPPGYSRRAG